MTRKAEDEEKRRKELENKLELVTHKVRNSKVLEESDTSFS